MIRKVGWCHEVRGLHSLILSTGQEDPKKAGSVLGHKQSLIRFVVVAGLFRDHARETPVPVQVVSGHPHRQFKGDEADAMMWFGQDPAHPGGAQGSPVPHLLVVFMRPHSHLLPLRGTAEGRAGCGRGEGWLACAGPRSPGARARLSRPPERAGRARGPRGRTAATSPAPRPPRRPPPSDARCPGGRP